MVEAVTWAAVAQADGPGVGTTGALLSRAVRGAGQAPRPWRPWRPWRPRQRAAAPPRRRVRRVFTCLLCRGVAHERGGVDGEVVAGHGLRLVEFPRRTGVELPALHLAPVAVRVQCLAAAEARHEARDDLFAPLHLHTEVGVTLRIRSRYEPPRPHRTWSKAYKGVGVGLGVGVGIGVLAPTLAVLAPRHRLTRRGVVGIAERDRPHGVRELGVPCTRLRWTASASAALAQAGVRASASYRAR